MSIFSLRSWLAFLPPQSSATCQAGKMVQICGGMEYRSRQLSWLGLPGWGSTAPGVIGKSNSKREHWLAKTKHVHIQCTHFARSTVSIYSIKHLRTLPKTYNTCKSNKIIFLIYVYWLLQINHYICIYTYICMYKYMYIYLCIHVLRSCIFVHSTLARSTLIYTIFHQK